MYRFRSRNHRRRSKVVAKHPDLTLDEIVAAIPYERGPKVISRDDQGDPVYEDIGLTPRFVELTRKYKKKLETTGKK